MDEMVKSWTQFGVMGLVILMLSYAVVALWKAYNGAMEKRIEERSEDRKEAYDALTSVTQPLQKQDQMLTLILNIVQNLRGRQSNV